MMSSQLLTVRVSVLAMTFAKVVVAAAACAVLVWAIYTLPFRPFLPGESEPLFEAGRIRAHLALYTDPAVGVFDYGAVPSRFYVVYPPLWSYLLAIVPGSPAIMGRVLSLLAWVAALACVALSARHKQPDKHPMQTPDPEARPIFGFVEGESRSRRSARSPRSSLSGCEEAPQLPEASLATINETQSRSKDACWFAALFGGTYNLALFTASARPDGLATALVGLALARIVRKTHVDPWSAALLALAAWCKPTFLGAAAGVLVVGLVRTPRQTLRALAVIAAVTSLIGGALMYISHGSWFLHLFRSNAQPLSFAHWSGIMSHEVYFFALPAAYALFRAWPHRQDPAVTLSLAALVGSLAWALLAIAKIGSATNYFLETCLAVVLVVATTPRRNLPLPMVGAMLTCIQVLWIGVASMRSCWEARTRDQDGPAIFAEARERCGADATHVTLSDDAGAELSVNGWIQSPAYQRLFLVGSNVWSSKTWADDLERREVGCFIEHWGFMRPLPNVGQVLSREFTLAAERGNWVLYARKPPIDQ
jgi:hypothetical protein